MHLKTTWLRFNALLYEGNRLQLPEFSLFKTLKKCFVL